MNWILLVMWAAASLVAAVIVGGLLVPAAYEARRTLVVQASPDRVRAALHGLAQWPVWLALARTPQLEVQGDVWTVSILNDDQQQQSTLTLTLEPQAAGAFVHAVDGGVIANPVTRLLRHYALGHGATAEAVLRGLAAALQEPAELRSA